MTQAGVSIPYIDPKFLVQIVKAVTKGMTNNTTHANPTVLTTPTALKITTTIDNVVLLV